MGSSIDKYTAIQKEILKIEQSEEVFCIRMGGNISDREEAGNFTYNVKTNQFDVNISNDNIWTNIEKLSHELKHADQYLNRKLTFKISANGKVTPDNYSIDDEIEAYNRQAMFGNTLSYDDIFKNYSKLHFYGENKVFKPTQEHIAINNCYLQRKNYPGVLYNGWKNDITK